MKNWVHLAYKYWGESDPTHEANCKVTKENIVERVVQLYSGRSHNKTCPKAHSLVRPADIVSFPSSHIWVILFYIIKEDLSDLFFVLQAREMEYWCPAPLPGGLEPRRKLRSAKNYQAPWRID
jgi:hypothetical protein